MEAIQNKTIGQIVADNYKAADVFKAYGIDFCCGGGISVQEACAKKELNYDQLMAELSTAYQSDAKKYEYGAWDINFLIDHIVAVHHTYVSTSVPIIQQYAERVAKVHGEEHPETVVVNRLFHAIAVDLTDHMKKEEQVLFPYIKEMVEAQASKKQKPIAVFGTVANPITMMELEHEHAGDILKEIDAITNGYELPEGACNTFRVLYNKLKEFEEDLHLHVHLENNILFPKAALLEQSFGGN